MPVESRVKDGLCSTCDNAPTCSYLPSRQGPVFHCEEFSAYTPPEVRDRRPRWGVAAANNPTSSAPRPSGRLGLCSTCDHWETCTLSGSEGGVWHCEEFE